MRNSTRRDRARIRRQNLNRNAYNHLTEHNIAQDGPIGSIIHINNGRIPDPFTLGLRDRPCYYNCNAKLFQKELDQTEFFFANTCCHRGHTVLQTDAIINSYPDELKFFLLGNHIDSNNFFQYIRRFNSAFAFASFGAQTVTPPGYGPFCFKIHGQIYHRSGILHPEANTNPKFGQIYILEGAGALQSRLNNNQRQ